MRPRLVRALSTTARSLVACALAAASCKNSAAPTEKALAPLSSASAPRTAGAPSATLPLVEKAPPACRALRVAGKVENAEHLAVATLSPLDGKSWLTLEPGAELVVRHAISAREYTLKGPGTAVPCFAGLEQVLLAEGQFVSARGTGVRPGAEVWVATPFGAVRYGDGETTTTVRKANWEVEVRGGPIFVEAAEGLAGAKNGELAGPKARATGSGRPSPEGLTTACEAAAQRALSEARAVMAAAPSELGSRAARQLKARREARARCMVAQASLGLAAPELAARLRDQLGHADLAWRTVPSADRK